MNIFGHTGTTPNKKSGGMLPLVLTAFMLAMALIPMIQPGSVSADDKPRLNIDVKKTNGPILIDIKPTKTPIVIKIDPDYQVDDPYTDEDIPLDIPDDVDVLPTQTPYFDPDVDIDNDLDVTVTASTGGNATIYINKHGCPASYDGNGKSFYDLALDCQDGSTGVEFGLSDGGGFVQTQSTGDYIANGVVFEGLAPGPWVVLEHVPDGFGAPRVFCDAKSPDELGGPANFVEESVAEGNQIFHLIEDGEYYSCDWFNFPSPDQGNGPVLHLPDSVEIFDTGDLPVIKLPNCVDNEEDATLHLPEGVKLNLGRRTISIDRDLIALEERAGTLPGDAKIDLSYSANLKLLDRDEGMDIIIPLCDEVEQASVDGTINIFKTECPANYDVASADIYDLAFDCQQPVENVGFILRDDNGQAFNFNKTGPSGTISFADVPEGPVQIQEELPLNYGEPVVYCITNDPAIPEIGDTIGQTVVGGDQVLMEMPEGGEINCQWFNVPPSATDAGDGEGTISISKSACPIGFDSASADVYDFAFSCNEPLQGVNFLLSDGNGAIATGVSDANGSIGFTDVPAIPVSIVEQVPAGYGEPAVFCISNTPDDNQIGDTVQQQVLAGNQIFHLMEEQESFSCSWYNVPSLANDAGDGEGTISIFKGECPVGFDTATADVYDYAFYCGQPVEDITFVLSDGAGAIGVSVTDDQGIAGFNGVEAIPVSIVEQVPVGYGEPAVFCISNVPGDNQVGDTVQQQVLDGNQIFHVMQEQESLSCTWYNIPADDGGEVVVHKYECDSAPGINTDMPAHLESKGCEIVDGVNFTLAYGIDTALPGTSGQDGPGTVIWSGVPATDIFINESVPAGYADPIVYCTDYVPGTPEPLGYDEYIAAGGTIGTTLSENEVLTCWWINLPEDDGKVVVIKHTCEKGYDLFAAGADPKKDCKTRTDGIEFEIEGPNGYEATGVTGDSGDTGKTTFDDLTPGNYVVTELVPSGTGQVFVLNCEDKQNPYIQGYPLELGSTLNVAVESGSSIVCYWYNVPENHYGAIQVTKYACPTDYFVDASDCEIYEGGIGFNLSAKQGGQWLDIANGTTNSAGKLTFSNLADGAYSIDEIGSSWCYAEADRTDNNGYLVVVPGKVTHLSVWNCGIKNVVKQPTKFPNTGAALVAVLSGGASAPVATAGTSMLSPYQWQGVMDGRLVAFLDRTERPVEVRIPSVELVAETETLEVVDGAMQDPTTADKVAWYKDTAKLGIDGNVVLAGHLNYWGIPEGVFFNLSKVEVGDEIAVAGDGGTLFRYRVTWVEQVDSQSSELSETVGKTDVPSLTLITCGGEWDPKAREYDERTVVRAELVTDAA